MVSDEVDDDVVIASLVVLCRLLQPMVKSKSRERS